MKRPHPALRATAFAAPLLVLSFVMSFTSVVEPSVVLLLLILAGAGLLLPGSGITAVAMILVTAVGLSPGLTAVAGAVAYLALWALISDVDRVVAVLFGTIILFPVLTASSIPAPVIFLAAPLAVLVAARSRLVALVKAPLGTTSFPTQPAHLPAPSTRLSEAGWPYVCAIDDGEDKAATVLHSSPNRDSYAVTRQGRVWIFSLFGDRYLGTTDARGGPTVPAELTQRIPGSRDLTDLIAAHREGLSLLRPHCGDPDPVDGESLEETFRGLHEADCRYILDHSWSVTARMYLHMITRPDRRLGDYRTETRIASWLDTPGRGRAPDTVTR